MTEEQKRPYEEVCFFGVSIIIESFRRITYYVTLKWQRNKEQYALEMEAYKQKKDEEAGHFMKEEEDHMKVQKQEALQLLKKKEKTENIIKVFSFTSFRF